MTLHTLVTPSLLLDFYCKSSTIPMFYLGCTLIPTFLALELDMTLILYAFRHKKWVVV